MSTIEKFCDEVEARGARRLKEAAARGERNVTDEMYQKNFDFLSKLTEGTSIYVGWFDACDFREYRTVKTIKIATPVVEHGAFLDIQHGHLILFRSRANHKLKTGTSIELGSIYEVGFWPFPYIPKQIVLGPKTNPHTSKKIHQRKIKVWR